MHRPATHVVRIHHDPARCPQPVLTWTSILKCPKVRREREGGAIVELQRDSMRLVDLGDNACVLALIDDFVGRREHSHTCQNRPAEQEGRTFLVEKRLPIVRDYGHVENVVRREVHEIALTATFAIEVTNED
jgi:hypothetical protein